MHSDNAAFEDSPISNTVRPNGFYEVIAYSYPCALCRIATGPPFSDSIIGSSFHLLVSDSQKSGTPYTDNTRYSDGNGFHRTVSNHGPVKHARSAQPHQQ